MTNREIILAMGTRSDQNINTEDMDLFRGAEYDGLRVEHYIDSENERDIVRFIGRGYERSFEISEKEARELFA